MSENPVVILTALEVEYRAVRAKITGLEPQTHAGTRFEVGRLPGSGRGVVLALVGKGNQAAAALTERAVQRFDPVAVVLVGVAGALYPSVALGDLVVATHVYAYHGGTSEDDGMKARPRVWETSHWAAQVAQHLTMSGDWTRHLPTGGAVPKVHFGPIAAGEVVQDSTTSAQARWVREHYNDALAIEMEAAGVAQAGHLSDAPIVVVRGISDRADGTKKDTDRARWQERAVASAAAFATGLAEALIVEGRGRTTKTREKGSQPMTSFANNASGNARVGVQVGQQFGDIRIGGEPAPAPDLERQLDELRAELGRARATGALDEETYEAADQELALVDKALPATSPPARGAVVLALKRLRGLVGDVAELVAKVTAIITAVRELS